MADSPSMAMRQTRTVFVLTGGANYGAVQVGMLRALLRAGITPDAVIGASVGAINAAAIAGDPTVRGADTLTEAWLGLGRDDIFPGSRLHRAVAIARRRVHLHDPRPLRRVIDRWLPYHDLSEAAIPVHVATTELATGRTSWWSSGPAVDVLAASAALPFVFPPVPLDGTLHVDGAVSETVPLGRAVDIGARHIYVLDAGATGRALPGPPATGVDALFSAIRASRLARLEVDRASVGRKHKVIWLPSVDGGRLAYDDFTHTGRLIEQAEQETADFLGGMARKGLGGVTANGSVVHCPSPRAWAWFQATQIGQARRKYRRAKAAA